MTATLTQDRVRCGRVSIGRDALILSDILQREVTLAIWQRGDSFALCAEAVTGFPAMRFVAPHDRVAVAVSAALETLPRHLWHWRFAQDVEDLAIRFADIMECDQVEVRIDLMVGNGCRKVHADYVTARLITTYFGQGTEWFGGDTERPEGQLETGAVGLFKGRNWAPDNPILHRSPPIAGTGEARLLLVIDPAPARALDGFA